MVSYLISLNFSPSFLPYKASSLQCATQLFLASHTSLGGLVATHSLAQSDCMTLLKSVPAFGNVGASFRSHSTSCCSSFAAVSYRYEPEVIVFLRYYTGEHVSNSQWGSNMIHHADYPSSCPHRPCVYIHLGATVLGVQLDTTVKGGSSESVISLR